ncbi:MAG: hypothetical protein AB7U63_08720 [Porticoccaceae bacterium]|jgi:Ca2+-binding EF-hand superfamily protein
MKYLLTPALALAMTGSVLAAETTNPQALIDKYTSMFQELDADSNQSLSKTEVSTAGLSDSSFSHLDVNRDGALDLKEFLALATSSTPATESSERE